MSQRSSLRDSYPMLSAFGGKHEFLSTQAAIEATRDERIQSIIPFLVKRLVAFQATLKPRERVNFDHDDTFSELWITIAEKDAEWTPERGKYITFVGVIIDRELSAIRDKSRTVHSPRNSSGRLKEYKAEEESETISARRRKTAEDIRRTTSASSVVVAAQDRITTEEPSHRATTRDARLGQIGAVIAAVRKLDAVEANILSRSMGLFGRDPQSIASISWDTGREPPEVRLIRHRALVKLRETLSKLGHDDSSLTAS